MKIKSDYIPGSIAMKNPFGAGTVIRYSEAGGKKKATRVIKMRPIITLCGQSDDEVVPPREEWQNTAGMKSVAVFVEVLGCSGASLFLESAGGAEGPWSQLVTFTEATVTSILLTGEGGSGAGGLQALLRWRIDGISAGWKTCFWMEATPEEPEGAIPWTGNKAQGEGG